MHLPALLRISAPVHYGIAILTILLAIGARMLLDPVLGEAEPFVTFVIAVLLTILYASPGASFLALTLALLSAKYFFIAPRYFLTVASRSDLFTIVLYGTIGVIAIALIQSQRRAQRRAEASARDALRKQHTLEQEIRQRQWAEEALRESEARFRAMFEEAAIGIALVDLDGRLIQSNPALQTLLGYTSDELRGMGIAEITHPDDVEASLSLARQVFAGHINHSQLQKRYLRKDGQPVWGHLTVSLIRNEDSAPLFAIGMVEDITERKQLEEQLRQAQKMEAIGRLAGGIAHDFNNLLMVITGYGRLLLERVPPEVRDWGEAVLLAGERATVLTRQLLAFSRKQVLTPTVLDLNKVISGMDVMLQRLVGEDIDLASALDPALGHVKADQGQIEQVIMNLVANARDAMPQGGRLVIETRNVDLKETTRQSQNVRIGHYVLLSVSDTGEGMDVTTRERLFEPFFTTKELGKGTGLGLATIYGIVKQSGGYIFVYSERGQGTTFKIYLPRVDELVTPLPFGPVEAVLPRGTETILLVEDEPGVRGFVRNVLQQYGYTVLEARHGIEALLVANQHPTSIHLLLTDVVMPQMSGPEVAEQLVSLRPDIKVLYMSGYSDNAVVHYGVMAPETTFLQKPYAPDILVRKVREVLDQVSHS